MTIVSLTQCRQRLTVRGTVQGVGFRPFVYRLATALGLGGGVKNTAEGVVIDIEGTEHALDVFRQRLQQDLPPHAAIQTLKQQSLPLQWLHDFQIWESEQTEDGTTTQILPDLATCPDCLKDIFDPDDRRFHYAFTNCTHCGPRFSIITALPYDRPHTTMATFSMCPDCQTEYMEPTNRRFHAQPNACSHCGPQLEFWIKGQVQSSHSMDDLIQGAIAALRRGEIVALKGLGGFQLLVDAQNPLAVARLRQQKGRPDKPLALMCSTVEVVSRYCEVSEEAASLLISAQAPIVLLPKAKPQKSDGLALADGIAPGNPYLGVMLPTTPLHHLLLHHYGAPLVATSGNASGAPICIDNQDARERLTSAADTFLVHNRPIQRPMDDSVVQIIQGKPQVLRHSRGYAPQAIQLQESLISNARILAVGAHMKNAIALSLGDQVVLSQYIGDLDTYSTIQRLQQTITDFLTLYRCQPTAIACDRHPDYQSTQLANTLAQQWDVPLIPVQH
ncbi:MAG: carbamoyltransferase HypF, partial [Cyanobacteria bacterium P01_A01_bin.37]